MKQTYPVIFTMIEKGVLIEVPDLNILSEGKNIADAIEMARDAISITIVSREDHKEVIPKPTDVLNINVSNGTFAKEGNSFVSIVDVDIQTYRKKIDTRPVRRNVSLPSWLNCEAEASGINVSKVLQEALINVLGLQSKYESLK